MNNEKLIWAVVLGLAAIFVLIKTLGTDHGMGKAYVKAEERAFIEVITPVELGGDGEEREWIQLGTEKAIDYDLTTESDRREWTHYHSAEYREYLEAVQADPLQDVIKLSGSRTIGLWFAAFFTLAIFSFLYKDNAAYKTAEAVVVGVSAAYWMVIGWWDQLVPNLLGNLFPDMVRAWFMPGLESTTDLVYIVPLILSVMLLWRLAPVGGWISRWPLAFIIGVFCGLKLVGFIHSDFLAQIRNSIKPVVVAGDTGVDVWDSIRNVILLIGILSCLVYFFFSFEHKGAVGATAKLGIWFLMVTFGAAFGYTVMGRIALLAIRLEFLFDDWLWLIDPAGRRTIASGVSMILPGWM